MRQGGPSPDPTPPPPGERPHVPALDGLRGVAILLVLLHHFASGMTGHGPVYRLFTAAAGAGWVGVDLFFVLSGFLITGILVDARDRGSPHYFRNFYARRFLRIFPLYYGTLALLLLPLARPLHARGVGAGDELISWVLGKDIGRDQVWHWLYATNVLLTVRRSWLPLGNFWTLAVEEHFYLLWPLAVFALGRGRSRTRLLWLAAGLFATALGLRLGQMLVYRAGFNPLALYTLTPCRMDSLAAGGFLALAARGPGGMASVAKAARWVAPAASAPLVAVAVRKGSFHAMSLECLSVGDSLLAAAFAALLALAVATPGRVLTHPALRSFGKYSYGLYVIHAVLWPAFPRWLPGYSAEIRTAPQFLGCLGYVALATAVCYALAWLSWHAYERPFLRLKAYFPE
jgi:peptidoglycan/LPS O-acetylase OafA/YrhL